MRQRRWKTWTLRSLAGLLLLALLATAGAWLYLRASLAQLEGERRAPGLSAQVTIARDAAGVPLISGSSRADVAYATGFVHAQERFFQMDLLRRTAAGELAELFGPRALPMDRGHRLHRFRARARLALARLPAAERALLERYVAGVNDGVKALGAKPFEYALTGAELRPWSAADSLLVVWAMYLDLQNNQEPRELARGWLREHSDAAQLAFLLPEASSWDATLDGGAAPAPAPIPPRAPAWWGQAAAPDASRQLAGATYVDSVGSNNYAVSGSRSASGAAIVSDDMHLGLQLPNIWYRVALRYPDAQGRQRRIVGVSLAGAPPAVIVGSNGQVAWAFTNSYADLVDLVALGSDASRPGQVRTPGGWETPVSHVEMIAVKGAPADRFVVRDTSLGPIREVGARQYALHWIAHDPAALNLNHLKLETAANVDEALSIAAIDGIPAQNFVAGDAVGNIGWTIAGLLPQRATAPVATTFPLNAEGPVATWAGLLPPARYPRVVNPADGQLSTANSRQLMNEGAALIGDGGFDIGARNRQLAEGLRALGPKTGVRQVFDVALDDRALFVARWRDRALAALDAQALEGHPARAEFRRLLETSWNGRASVDSVGFRLARGYMWGLHDVFYGGAGKAMRELGRTVTPVSASSRWPDVIARLLEARPAGWLPPGYADWRAVELAAVDRVIRDLTKDGKPLSQASWGARNTASIGHPIGMAVPALKSWLSAPADQLAGDANMPRVAGPTFGQSERMTVSPGREEEGLYNMPGGQSGHPLSPFFLAGHREWTQAQPVPLLPGTPQYTLRLIP